MTLHVLIVEDDDGFYSDIAQVITEAAQGASDFARAADRDAGIRLLRERYFDYVILDLRIPPNGAGQDADPQHGRAVFSEARSVAPGTPVLVLTGSPAEDFIPEMLAQQSRIDIWSRGEEDGTISFLKKYNFDDLPARIATVAHAVNSLSDVELELNDVNLSQEEDRLLRIFSRKFKGTRCRVSLISGGLSPARVMRVRVTDATGARVHDVIAKLGPIPIIRDETDRFDNFVGRLDPKVTPRRIVTMEYGARSSGAVFYGLAEGFEYSGFDVAFRNAAPAKVTVQGVEENTARWRDRVPETRRTIAEIRRKVLTDQSAKEVADRYGLSWVAAFEAQQIQVRWAPIHGDLHGANLLVGVSGISVLIDYGDVGEGPASLDPVTLELSLLFHPQHSQTDWPSAAQAKKWGDLDSYLLGCPFPDFVRACRSWASRVAAGRRDVAASAYSYLLRQLKYEDTNKDLALNLLDGVQAFFAST